MTVTKLLTAVRDWWHRPVTDRLDALIANNTKRVKVTSEPRPETNPRGYWATTMPRN